MSEDTIAILAKRYTQLRIPIAPGAGDSEEYENAVLRGKSIDREPAFLTSPEDSLSLIQTPEGPVEVLYLANREDFEHALRALAHRCEPVEIPASVGASTIIGLINWDKIRARQKVYFLAGGRDWSAEFRRFTSVGSNYRDILILLSSGEYSAISADQLGLEQQDWLEKSRIIRCYHELTHFVCRRRRPEDVDAIRDEVLADLIGIVTAFGHYNPKMARLFLGIEGDSFRSGGRLSYYTTEEKLSEAVSRAEHWIEEYAARLAEGQDEDCFAQMLRLFG